MPTRGAPGGLSAGELTATRYEFNESTDEFVSLDDRRPIEDWTGEVPVVGVDCMDQAQHEQQPAPGPSERCPLGQLPGIAQSDHVGDLIEGTRTAGEIGCERIVQLWGEYDKAPKDPVSNGKALIADFGGHSCSTPLTLGTARAGKVGACTARDEPWAFDVVPR